LGLFLGGVRKQGIPPAGFFSSVWRNLTENTVSERLDRGDVERNSKHDFSATNNRE